MIFITCSPDNPYFHWQVEVYLNNFLKMGIPIEKIQMLWMTRGEITEEVKTLQSKYNANFYYYNDEREKQHYIPTIKPFLLKQHLKAFPELNKEAIFYHDSDILFTKEIDFVRFEKDDVWYMSDTINYIGYDYLLSKGEEIIDGMCKIVGIDKQTVKDNMGSSGGGQYIVKGSNYEFWDKVEKDSVKLYDYLKSTEPLYVKKHEGDYPVQSWCAEMWATLWNMWYFKHTTKVDKELDFVFATDTYKRAMEVSIFHNAGVTSTNKELFYKGAWINKSPIGQIIDIPADDKASKIYVEAIMNVKTNNYDTKKD